MYKLRSIFSSRRRGHSTSTLQYQDSPPAYSKHSWGLKTPTQATRRSISPQPLPPPSAFIKSPVDQQDYSPLRSFDTAFLIDDSRSMAGTNWHQTANALSSIIPIVCTYDTNGIDVYFLNNAKISQNVRSANEIFNIFAETRPQGSTPMGRRLGQILRDYMAMYCAKRGVGVKPLNIIVITDGTPSDPEVLEREIIWTASELDRLNAKDRQIGIQFFQVGNDAEAAESLEELDNALCEEHHVRDMVDTVTFRSVQGMGDSLTAEGMLKIVLGAVDGTLDKKRLKPRY